MPGPRPVLDDAHDNLPDDVGVLRQALSVSRAEIRLLNLTVAKLKLQLARRNRALYGQSSERFAGTQASLLDLPVPPQPPKPDARRGKAGSGERRDAHDDGAANRRTVDRSLPPHLPRETTELRPPVTDQHQDAAGQPCGCTACGGRLRRIGADVSEQLEYVPGYFKVLRTVRPKLACARCQGVFQAGAPSRPAARLQAGPALLAHVSAGKYADHNPLHRQSRAYARSGVDVEASTLCGWIAQGDRLAEPLVRRCSGATSWAGRSCTPTTRR